MTPTVQAPAAHLLLRGLLLLVLDWVPQGTIRPMRFSSACQASMRFSIVTGKHMTLR